jgi:hypothetical protein
VEAARHRSAKMVMSVSINESRGKSMVIIRIGVDLAKNVFAVHGVDEAGRVALTRQRCGGDLRSGRPPQHAPIRSVEAVNRHRCNELRIEVRQVGSWAVLGQTECPNLA